MRDMNGIVGTHDVVLVTLDTLRFDVADELLDAGETPRFASVLPGGRWERRHAPGSFTYAAHTAMLAGFLPTPAEPGPHPRLFAAAFPGSETTSAGTFAFDAATLPEGLADVGYHTVCIGGVGFFNKQTALGSALPSLFAESHWEPSFGVTDPSSLDNQIERIEKSVAALPSERRLFLLLNVSALHQPNWFYLDGATRGSGDTRASHAAALRYVDARLPRLLGALRRPSLVIICSDHGTAYGEDGHVGHRIGHEVVWTVPYGEFVLS
ncbi:STM4013/SEN3800 family hydrolase [Actinomadura rupiterrae]|uniref:STM4013/SEN3800 family hydrolase n=1 Tax=Actinomadura rupiterrae TaxID=559627 RepID=UPI003FD7ECB2